MLSQHVITAVSKMSPAERKVLIAFAKALDSLINETPVTSKHTNTPLLEDCELTVRTYNALRTQFDVGSTHLGDVLDLSDNALLKLPNFGRKSLRELRKLGDFYQQDRLPDIS